MPFCDSELTFSAFCDILSVETGFILGSVSDVLFRASALDDGEVACFLFVELLPFVSDVPVKAFAFTGGVRLPQGDLSLKIANDSCSW